MSAPILGTQNMYDIDLKKKKVWEPYLKAIMKGQIILHMLIYKPFIHQCALLSCSRISSTSIKPNCP